MQVMEIIDSCAHFRRRSAGKKCAKQFGGIFSQDRTWQTGESANLQMLEIMEANAWVLVGWVHTHPTFDAYLSSIDQHMAFCIQRDLSAAFSIVIDKTQTPFSSS